MVNAIVFSKNNQGSSHITENKPNQDYSLHRISDDGIGAIVVVADGHGSEEHFRSADGSRMACEVAIEVLEPLLLPENCDALHQQLLIDTEGALRRLESQVVAKWYERVKTHLSEKSFADEEFKVLDAEKARAYKTGEHAHKAYGTTLIAAFASEKYWFCIKIGDGDCVVTRSSGVYEHPVPVGPGKQGNRTDSLSSSSAMKGFTHHFEEGKPAGIFVYTDGIEDSYDSASLGIAEKLLKIGNLFLKQPDLSTDDRYYQLSIILDDISLNGSADDVSVAGILSGESLPKPAYSRSMLEQATARAEYEIENLEIILKNDNNSLGKARDKFYKKRNAFKEELDKDGAVIADIESKIAAKSERLNAFYKKKDYYGKKLKEMDSGIDGDEGEDGEDGDQIIDAVTKVYEKAAVIEEKAAVEPEVKAVVEAEENTVIDPDENTTEKTDENTEIEPDGSVAANTEEKVKEKPEQKEDAKPEKKEQNFIVRGFNNLLGDSRRKKNDTTDDSG